jgi:hypothetical protein
MHGPMNIKKKWMLRKWVMEGMDRIELAQDRDR